MHPYESTRPQHSPGHAAIPGQLGSPARRGPYDQGRSGSETPIFDSLYDEYRRLFRALPGDRTGEEELRFEGFGTIHGTGTSGGTASWRYYGRPEQGHLPGAYYPGEVSVPGRNFPAALPPARRDAGG
ncbi:hypothetical protein ACFV5N_20700 [Streptomyces sp. NPDC059853]|uniref:hypothetical protein n=1 Tax=Streptomyces sp. NPDC059853 TaxID=3346973 RepID=UPI00365F32E1